MKIKDVVILSACTFLVIIGAYISLPIGPVPIVLTNFFIVLIALLLGWEKAVLVVITYMILGIVGLPVFSNGKGGIAHVIGLTGGFLFGFLPLALFSGFGKDKGVILKVIFTLIGSLLLYAIGVPWAKYVYNNVIAINANKPLWDLATTLKYTTIPFIIPDLIKIGLAIVLSNILKPVLKPFINNENE